METAKLNIKQWAEDDRPREKMMQKGASALSNAELLAILIGSGTVEESAVGLMKRVMADCDNRLKTLGRMSLEELTGNVEVWDKETGKKKRVRRYKGLGEAKAVAIMAAVTIRNLSEEAHRALKVRAAQHNRSTEAEMRAILEAAVRPEGRLRLGTALSETSRRIGLTNADVEALEQARETRPAEPMRVE